MVCLGLASDGAVDARTLNSGLQSFVCATRGDSVFCGCDRNVSFSFSPLGVAALGKLHDGFRTLLDHAVSFVVGGAAAIFSSLVLFSVQGSGARLSAKPYMVHGGSDCARRLTGSDFH